MKTDGTERVEHMRDYIQKIQNATSGIDRHAFEADWILQAAIVRFI